MVLSRQTLPGRQAQGLARHVEEGLTDHPRVVQRVVRHLPILARLLSHPTVRASLLEMRLVTRPDLDGLTCAVLLSHCETVNAYEFVHPQQIRDRQVEIGKDDILANVPYHPACGMWFDNHLLTDSVSTPPQGFQGRYGQAPSAAHLVYEHYLPTHPDLSRYEELVRETDRLDSAQLELNDVLSPRGYMLLGFTLDPKSGLDGVEEYFLDLLPAIKTSKIEEVLELAQVKERARRLREQDRGFREVAMAHSRLDGGVVVTDFRAVDPLPVGNRFLIYTVYPEATVSMRIQHGRAPETIAVSVGRSIFNRTSRANVGVLMSMYGGGGQPGAGACVLQAEKADAQIDEIIAALKRNA